MKLRHWIDENVPSYKRGTWADKVLDGLHVIGPCDDCKFLSKDHLEICENEKAFGFGCAVRDGCIYFEQKK